MGPYSGSETGGNGCIVMGVLVTSPEGAGTYSGSESGGRECVTRGALVISPEGAGTPGEWLEGSKAGAKATFSGSIAGSGAGADFKVSDREEFSLLGGSDGTRSIAPCVLLRA